MRKIEVVNYDSRWPILFAQEQQQISKIINGLAIKIEQIGSTAVPNLAAKPIIDILIEVSELQPLDTKADDFKQAGYAVMGEHGMTGRRYYQKGGDKRTHHLHAFQTGDHHLVRHRAFKAYLIAFPEVAKLYTRIV